MSRLILLLFPVFLLLAARCGQVAAHPPAEAGVEGTWTPLPNEAGQGGSVPAGAWSMAPEQKELSLLVEAGQTGAWRMARAEPLPDGDWTLDLAFTTPAYSSTNVLLQVGGRSANGERTPGAWSVEVEPRGEEAGVRIYTYGRSMEGSLGQTSSGTTHWLRLAYHAATRKLVGWINGKPLRGTAEGLALAREPIALGARSRSRDNQAQKLTLNLFRVKPGLPPAPTSAVGLAEKGWQRGKPAEQVVVPSELLAKLNEIAASGEVEPEGRGAALAALLLADWATRGRASAETWERAAQFVEKSPDVDVRALSVLTPIAMACAGEKNLPQTRKWARVFFAGLTLEPQNQWTENQMLIRMSLCDPAQTASQLLKRSMPHRIAFALAGEIKDSDPALALAVYQSINPNPAWILPELRAVAPLQAQNIVNRLLAGQAASAQSGAGRDQIFAAYRLANADLPLALTLLGRVQNPNDRATTLSFISESLRFALNATPDPKMEAALRQMVALWQPTERDDSSVPLLVRLAEWQMITGQKEAAQATLREAAEKIGKLPATRFRDTWAIARLALQGQMPDATAWWDKARTAATQRERPEAGFSDFAYGERAPLAIMTRDLLSDGQRERALELLRAAPQGTDTSAAWQALLTATLREEPAQAGAVFSAVPEGYQRAELAQSVTRRLSLSDPAAARAVLPRLLEHLPAETRERLEQSLMPADGKALRDEVSAALKNLRPGVPPPTPGNNVLARVERLPLSELVALEPAFADHRAVYARLCLGTIVRAAGLTRDPIWQRFLAAEDQSGWSIPWGVSNLEYAVRAEQQNLRSRD